MRARPLLPDAAYNPRFMPRTPLFNIRRALPLALCLAAVAGCEGPAIIDGMLEMEDTPSAKEAVASLITSNNPDTRRKAVGFLSDRDFGGEPLYRRVYIQYGLTDADAGVRQAAVRALGDHGGADDALALLPLLADQDVGVRLAVADALRKLRLPAGGEAWTKAQSGLIKLLGDEQVDVRSMAADALGQYSSELSMRALMDALEDPSFSVAWYARRSLAAIAGPDAKIGDPYDARQWGAWLASAKLDPASVHYLWEPYYRRPWKVQWGWQPQTYFYEPPALEAPRVRAIREESSLVSKDASKDAPQGQKPREKFKLESD